MLSNKLVWYWHSSEYWQLQIEQVAEWAHAGQSGSVIGLTGSGVASVLNMVVRRPALLADYRPNSPLTIVPVAIEATTFDAENYPNRLYRDFLVALYEARAALPVELWRSVEDAYNQNLTATDPYLIQVAIRQLFYQFQAASVRIVLVIDRFDLFCERASEEWAFWLASLRETFPNEICYVAGLRGTRRLARHSTVTTTLCRLVDSQTCWVGGLTPYAAGRMIQTTTQLPIGSEDNERLLELTGRFPMLIHVACNWWSYEAARLNSADWLSALLDYPALNARLHQLWSELTYREKTVLTNLELLPDSAYSDLVEGNLSVLHELARKGVCETNHGIWRISGRLLAAYAENARFTVRGKVWFNPHDDTFYQGKQPLQFLSPRAEAALHYFLAHPYKKCDKDALINHIWETPYVTDDSVYQVIRELRRYLEPDSNNPVYIINHRSGRGGRYQFFPEGRPQHYQNKQFD